jgi:hypothetical protein
MTPVKARPRLFVRLLSLALMIGLAGTAQAQSIIAQYPLGSNGETSNPAVLNAGRSGPGYEATTVDPNATAMDVSISDSIPPSAEEYIEDPPTGPLYGFPVFRFQPGSNSRTPAEAVTKDKYFTFTVTANAGFTLHLANLTFDAARGGGATPRGFVLLSDVDGFTNPIDSEDVPTQRNVQTTFTIDLSGAAYQGLSEVTFRIYAYTPSGGQSVEFSNLTLNGTVQ